MPPLQRLLTHLLAAATAAALIGLTDGILVVSSTGLEPLEGSTAFAVVGLLVAMNLALAPLLGIAVGLAVVGLVALRGEETVARVQRILFHPITIAVTAALGVGAVAVYGWNKHLVWSALPWELPGLALLGVLAYLTVLRLGRKLEARGRGVALGGLGVVMAVSATSWSGLEEERDLALERVGSHATTGIPLLGLARGAFDGDNDAFPTAFCATDCDCDDGNAAVFPGAPEVSDNGVDEDCNGRDQTTADLQRIAALLKPPAEPSLPEPVVEGHRPDEPPPPEPRLLELSREGPPNVLFITVDTLRADHLGYLGYPLNTSPHLDDLAKRGVIFEQARSTGPMTRFAMGPLMTGKFFAEIQRKGHEWPVISEAEMMLAERIKAAGYHTAAFHSIDYFKPEYGFAQGFDHYDVSCLEARPEFRVKQTSDYINKVVLEHVDSDAFGEVLSRDAPWMLWVYYSDPHHYYIKHSYFEEFEDHTSNDDMARYDSEIRFTDEHIGTLLDALAERDMLKDTVIVFHSDHGEALDKKVDHGQLWHGANLYDEAIRVPLFVVGPGLEPRRVKTPVSLIDVTPTLIELLDLEPSSEQRGVSLVPWLRGDPDAHRAPIFFEKHRKHRSMKWPPGRKMVGMVKWPYKVIWVPRYNRFQVYDLSQDPAEQKNVFTVLSSDEQESLTELVLYWSNHVLEPVEPDK